MWEASFPNTTYTFEVFAIYTYVYQGQTYKGLSPASPIVERVPTGTLARPSGR